MEFSEAGHEIKYFGFRRVVTGVIFLGRLDDDVDHVREAATAAAPFPHGVVYLCRHDKLPTILIEKFVDDFPDFVIGYVVAAADKHGVIPNMTFTIPFSAKEDDRCQEKIDSQNRPFVAHCGTDEGTLRYTAKPQIRRSDARSQWKLRPFGMI